MFLILASFDLWAASGECKITTMKTEITATKLREILFYDAASGEFTRLVKTAPVVSIGDIAGSIKPDGRCYISAGGRLHLAHRLAWLYVHGCWPHGDIDHIDGNPSNNRLSNLRDVPHAVNQQNRRQPMKNNQAKILGVWRHKDQWRAAVQVAGKRHYAGLFDTSEEAHAAYIALKRRMHVGCTI